VDIDVGASSAPQSPAQHESASTGTVAVVVTYKPDLHRLLEGLTAIAPQVDSVVIVDNGVATFESAVTTALGQKVTVDSLGSNRGIAFAQNRGIALAREQAARFVLLLDQDSVASARMLAHLHAARLALHDCGERVGALGPTQRDGLATGSPRFTRFERARYRQFEAPVGALFVACDMLIASGTLVPVEVLDAVGVMDETLFIDKVDTEWCLRASRCGFGVYGVPAAELFHRLGESMLAVSWWRGKRLPVHKPFRYYYMVRNSFLLHRRPHARWAWRLADVSQLLQIIVFHGLIAPNARQNRPMIWRGLRDGIRAVTGPLGP
jgi:rhamnosyltransferase